MDSDLKSFQEVSSALEVRPSENRSESGGSQEDKDKLTTPGVSSSSGSSDGTSEGACTQLNVEEVEKIVKDRTLLTTMDDTKKKVVILNLIEARTQSADGKRSARKAAWIAETQKEILKRKQFRENEMLMKVPELVYERIMDHVQGYEEKTGMLNLSLLWRDMVKNKRTQFLFSKVFVALHEGGHLGRAEILTCRGACQEWKNNIENHLQNFLNVQAEQAVTALSLRPFSDCGLDLLFMSFGIILHRLDRFITWTNQTYSPDANPFISRKLRLGYEGHHEFQLYWREMGRFLQARGRQVWQAELILEKDLSCINVYDRIRDCLRMMPNLKVLKIIGHYELILSDLDRPQSKQTKERLKMHITDNPLPDVSNLKSILTLAIPQPIIQEMMNKYGSTLDTVSYSAGVSGNPFSYAGEANNLPELKRLRLSSYHLTFAESKFTLNWSTLREVDLVYLNIEAAAIPNLFQALSGLRTSLRRLVLSLEEKDGPVIKLDCCTMKMLSLDLPHLEELTFSVSRINLRTVDFLLPLVAMKELNVSYVKRVSKLQNESNEDKKVEPEAGSSKSVSDDVIQFGDYTNRLYESNIWEILPELKKVAISIIRRVKKLVLGHEPDFVKQKLYTREGYKQHCAAIAVKH